MRITPALLSLAALSALSAGAQDLPRDPTVLPAALRAAVAASAASAANAEAADNAIRQVVFAGGRAYVVQRGRRYAVGEQLDGARIERITEQAVWLREAGQLRREPLYGGVEKRVTVPATASGAHKKSKEKQP